MDLDALLADLLSKFNANKDSVFAAFQGKAHALYQMAFDAGHRVATAAGRTELEAEQAKVVQANKDKLAAEKALQKLQAEQPDVAKVTADFQKEIADLKSAHEKALGEERGKREAADHGRVMADLHIRLGKLLKPAMAKLLVQDQDVKSRVKVKPDGSYEVMQAGKAIPFSPAEGKEVLDLLASELAEKQEAEWRLADGDEGSGVQNGVHNAGGGKGDVFARIREKKKAEVDAAAKKPTTTLEDRLGMVAR